MSSVTFAVKQDDVDELVEKMLDYPGNVETQINTYLSKEAVPKVNISIMNLIPISKVKKKHARENNPLQSKMVNLGFIISTKTPFNYLYFPDQGKGTSSKNKAQEFFEKGLYLQYEGIVQGMLKVLEL